MEMIRNKNFKLAVGTSFASKLATVILQVLAMPIVVTSLGKGGFVVYSILLSINSWLLLSTAGISPALMVRLSGITKKGKSAVWISNGYCLFFIIGILISISFYLLNSFLEIPQYIASSTNVFYQDISTSISLISIMFFFQALCIGSDAVILAKQKQYITNLSVLMATLLSIILVIFLSDSLDKPSLFIFVIFVPSVLVRFITGSYFIWHFRYFNLGLYSPIYIKILFREAIKFFKAGSLTNFLLHVLPIVIVGKVYSEDFSAQYVSLNNFIILASGIVSLVCIPLTPALRDSIVRKDVGWELKASQKLRRYCLGIVAVSLILGWSLATAILNKYFDEEILFNYYFVGSASVYFATLVWSNYNYCIFAAHNKIDFISKIFFKKAIISIIIVLMISLFKLQINPFIIFSIAFFSIELIATNRYKKENL